MKTSFVEANKRRIRVGGLLRCCIGTVAECDDESDIGTILHCKYCKDGMVVVAKDGVWEWLQGIDGIWALNHCADCSERIAKDHKGHTLLQGDFVVGRVHAGCNAEVEVRCD